MTTSPTTRQHYLTADQLRPGDIVLDVQGKTRWFAAFDVDTRDGEIRAYTAIADQDNGVPEVLYFGPLAALLVERRVDGPQTTRTTLTLHDDGSVAIS